MHCYERIIKECFWDLRITVDDIEAIIHGSDFRKKSMLFEKILLNSTSLFQDLKIFTKDDLEALIENYKIPPFNADYAFRRKNMAEVFFFDKPLLIEELKWAS